MSSGIQCIYLEAQKAMELAQSSENVPEALVESTKRLTRLLQDYNDYLERMASPLSKDVSGIVDFTMNHDWVKFAQENSTGPIEPRMITGRQEAQLLRLLVSMTKASRVLEIGMFTGCASLAMAEGLPSNGSLVTCEILPALETIVRALVDKSPHGKKITIKIGPAMETLKALSAEGQQFDFVFIDADKPNYVNFFKYILDSNLLLPGGTICCDNVLWGGNAFLPPGERGNRPFVHSIPEFNEAVLNDDRVYRVMLPVRDGIFLIRRKDDTDVDRKD